MNSRDFWQIGPFEREGGAILGPTDAPEFPCPLRHETVRWAAKDVFNPGAVVRGDEVCLLVRAEDFEGRYAGTSRIGLATSRDGRHFTLQNAPVLFPDDDAWRAWEWEGGCEDPRVVEHPDGGYVCLYSAFDGKFCSLFAATSPDLEVWHKHGPAFSGAHAKRWAKSAAIVTELRDGRLVAARINGQFWLYWGEGVCYGATSPDLVSWQPLESPANPDRFLTFKPNEGAGWWDTHHLGKNDALRPLLFPRRGRFDSLLVEPGPPAVLTPNGIVLIYNGGNHPQNGDAALPPGAYSPGQLLFDALDPASLIARPDKPFLSAQGAETSGQYHNVCFAQGLVAFQNQWRLYFGMADSQIGCAVAPMNEPN